MSRFAQDYYEENENDELEELENTSEETAPRSRIDWLIFIPVVSLMLFGIAFVYGGSAGQAAAKMGSSSSLVINHAVKVIIGIFIIIIFSRIDYNKIRPVSKTLIFISAISLVLVLLFGISQKGAVRWLDLGFITFQPSELAKFAIVLHFGSILAARQDEIESKGSLVPFLFWIILICILIALQPNFSTMMVVFMISFLIMFVGNVRPKYLLYMILIGLSLASIYFVSASYRLNRLKAYLGLGDGEGAIENVNYQLRQSLIALGNGGAVGVGPGQSRQSELFLPESYGDFIFAVIGEEYGFIGLTIVLSLYLLIFLRGMVVAKRAKNNFGYFLAVGIVITFAIYVFVNAGVNTGLLPSTGVPLPFISYGGTALFMYSAAVGILLNISSQAETYGVSLKSALFQKNVSSEDDISDS
ncbi:MAG: putative peptidoglycan glycosyltransferase FtsW [Candidatus Kapaibacteriales bacterium]